MQDDTTKRTGQQADPQELDGKDGPEAETEDALVEVPAEIAPLEPPPAELVELAEACVRHVKRALGFQLDFSPETLPVLDHYLREARDAHGDRAELLAMIALPAGAYFGEVVRRVIPARWFAPEDEYTRWRLELVHTFAAFNPIGAAFEAMLGEELAGWGAHLQLRPIDQGRIRTVLDQLPEVPVDEFLAPSSRLEILELVVDYLGRGVEPRSYDAGDYGPFRTEAIALGGGGSVEPN